MPPEPSADLCELVRRAQAGDEEAAQKVHDQCREPLLAAVRHVLDRSPRLRQIHDSTDFLQDAFLEIFTRVFDQKVLRSPASLIAYMRKIAQNKVRNECTRRLGTKRFRIDREGSLEGNEHFAACHGLSPQDAAILRELAGAWVEEKFAGLNLASRAIATALLNGRGIEGVAALVNVSLADAEIWVRKAEFAIAN